MLEQHARARVQRQRDIARDHRGLRARHRARHAELLRRRRAVVYPGRGHERGLLLVEGQQNAQRRGLLHRRAAQARARQVDAVVGQAGRARGLERGKIGHLLPLEPLGHRACLQHLDRAVLCLVGHIADDLGRVAGGQGVRHADHGRVSARCGCGRAGQHVLLLRLARVAEVHMAVDKAGRDGQPRGVICFAARGRVDVRRDTRNHAVVPDEHIHFFVGIGIRVEHPSVLNEQHKGISFRSFPILQSFTCIVPLKQRRRQSFARTAACHFYIRWSKVTTGLYR